MNAEHGAFKCGQQLQELGGLGRRWHNILAHLFGKSRRAASLRSGIPPSVSRHRFDEFDDEYYNAVNFIKN